MTKASFTCDHCSAAVDLHAVRCPSCGKAFDAVKCPRCGHQGPPGSFSDGCPRCRYLASRSPGAPNRPREPRPSLFVPSMAVLLVLLVLAAAAAWVLRRG